MIKLYSRLLSIIVVVAVINGCDKGIAPVSADANQKAGFGGTITFTGTWPDSVKRTHLVVFENPLNSAADFNIFNLKYISSEIPLGTTSINYSSLDSSLVTIGAGTYRYIAVAQSSSPAVSLDRKDWFVVGVYYAGSTSTPGVLTIPENTYMGNINIACDFNHLPPQPPGGN